MKQSILGLGSCIFLAVAAIGWGQEPADPPSRVARLSLIQGSVSFRPESLQDWSAATLNYPLSTGDHLWTDENSYADLHIGATAIHLAPQTAFAMAYLNDTVTQMSLTQGSLYVRIPSLDKGEVIEIDTPNGAVSLRQAGAYRVDVDGDPSATFVRVRAGAAETTASGQTYQTRPGTMLRLVANQEGLESIDATPPDGWEQECATRDQLSEQYRTISESYVPAEMDGAEDLAQYGEWSTDSTYGAVWTPAGVASSWAPYRNGRWVFVPHWGWTWVDDTKWGFAPFHYGRWLVANGHWVWVPGSRQVHPVYAPALVAFVRGIRFNPGLPPRRGPLTAWLPLAPGEPYRPQHPVSADYLRRVNAPDVRGAALAGNQTVGYRNHAWTTAVPDEIFRGAKPVSKARVPIPQGGSAAVVPISISAVRPLPESHSLVVAKAPPADTVSRTVVAKHEIPRTATPIVPVVSSSSQVSSPPPAPAARQSQPPQQRVEQPRAEPARSIPQTNIDQRAEQQRADQQRQDQQHTDQQRAEQQRQDQQRTDQQRAEQQRQDQQRTDQQRAEQQRQEQQRAAQQRTDQQRQEQQRADQQRAEQQRQEQQRAEQQRADQQRQEQQRADQQRVEQQRQEQQRAAQQRADQQRQEQQRAEQQRAEQQRQEQQRAAQQHAEQQRQEQQRQDQQRADQQRAEQQRQEQQRQEQQRAEEAKKAEEAARKKQ